MPLIQLKFRPGIVRDLTDYAGQGGWFDCSWVRFRAGLPEKMGGWAFKIITQFLGVCRALTSWTLLTGAQYLGLGTNLKFYVSDGSSYIDVTPIRRTVTLANNPFATTNGNTTMTVTDTANLSVVNDFVTFSGASAFAGLTTGNLNQEFQIASIVDANHYTVTLSATPNATTSGGGAAVVAAYQINVGLNTTVVGLGWGAGTWGHDTWGSNATTGPALQLRIWSVDTFGQNLLTCVRNGAIYLWDATAPSSRMKNLVDVTGADADTPEVATCVLVSPEEAHTVAFGCNPLGSSVQDPLLVRWSDTESYTVWTPTEENTAGGYRLSVGTQIIGVAHTRGQVLIWTDLALYTMTWTGVPYVFNFQLAGYNVSMIGPNAMAAYNDVTYWMGNNQFYLYDGRIQVMPCPITDFIFERLNVFQSYKVFGFTNAMFNEVGWLYASGSECDSYVIYNTREQAWYFGDLQRTAWADLGASYLPLATSTDSYLFSHEFGLDDGSTNPPTAIAAFIESSPLEAQQEGSGERFLFMDRIIPDVTFRNSTATSPTVVMTLKTQDYPGQAVAQSQASDINSTSAEITQFTDQAFIRLRGRSAVFRCESDELGVTWRLGIPRVSYRLDGRR